MTTPPLNDELIFAYLDGELDQNQIRDLETRIAENPELQERIDRLNSINDSIHRIAHSDPAPIKFTQQTDPRRSTLKWIAYAAVIAIAAPLVIFLNQPPQQKRFDAERFYVSTTTDFVPDIVCDTPEKFEEYTYEAFGKTITADFETPVQLVGWKYFSKNYTPEELKDKDTTRALVGMSAEGAPLLAVFPSKNFSELTLDPGSDLYMHTTRINSIRVIEISPYKDPILLDLMSKK
ncbi:MAG: hypothetical protein JJ974_01565 [Phycisphaerales bacterium]|nr:hypothetical protein [Phycisphaerales bacterium]